MEVIVLDVETTIKNEGNPFTKSNKLCVVGLGSDVHKIEYDDAPYGQNLTKIKEALSNCKTLVGFNLKFDLHWLRRYGINIHDFQCNVWDVQYAHFCIRSQQTPYPSLNDVCEFYGLEKKIDVVANEYWDKGIDTPEVPYSLLDEYTKKDLELTLRCYEKQMEYLQDMPKLKTLIRMGNLDLLVLEEMEWNGILISLEACKEKSNQLLDRIKEIDEELTFSIGFPNINWNSIFHVSAVLYGGVIPYTSKELVQLTLKSGKVVTRLRNVEHKQTFPRLVEPLKGTALDKAGYFSTAEDTLTQLKATKKVRYFIDLLLERHKISKMNGTYYEGVPKLLNKMEWENNTVHGNLNQCVAITGRLSSTKPNQQNMPAEFFTVFKSRYD